jgi:predicted nuclease of restriction endonuclease-like RecB superfamily
MKYRSGIEKDVAKQLGLKKIKFTYEKVKIPYTKITHHNYVPDFIIKTKSGKEIIIEVKGIWVFVDRYKHLLIRKQHPELDIRFVFTNSKNKIRKGSKCTYADICNGKGKGQFKDVTWKYSDKKIAKDWLLE